MLKDHPHPAVAVALDQQLLVRPHWGSRPILLARSCRPAARSGRISGCCASLPPARPSGPGSTFSSTVPAVSDNRRVLPSSSLAQASRHCPLIDTQPSREAWASCCSRRFFPWPGASPDRDDLIETLYFPGTSVTLRSCDHDGCPERTSSWVDMSRSTNSDVQVDAELRMKASAQVFAACDWNW